MQSSKLRQPVKSTSLSTSTSQPKSSLKPPSTTTSKLPSSSKSTSTTPSTTTSTTSTTTKGIPTTVKKVTSTTTTPVVTANGKSATKTTKIITTTTTIKTTKTTKTTNSNTTDTVSSTPTIETDLNNNNNNEEDIGSTSSPFLVSSASEENDKKEQQPSNQNAESEVSLDTKNAIKMGGDDNDERVTVSVGDQSLNNPEESTTTTISSSITPPTPIVVKKPATTSSIPTKKQSALKKPVTSTSTTTTSTVAKKPTTTQTTSAAAKTVDTTVQPKKTTTGIKPPTASVTKKPATATVSKPTTTTQKPLATATKTTTATTTTPKVATGIKTPTASSSKKPAAGTISTTKTTIASTAPKASPSTTSTTTTTKSATGIKPPATTAVVKKPAAASTTVAKKAAATVQTKSTTPTTSKPTTTTAIKSTVAKTPSSTNTTSKTITATPSKSTSTTPVKAITTTKTTTPTKTVKTTTTTTTTTTTKTNSIKSPIKSTDSIKATTPTKLTTTPVKTTTTTATTPTKSVFDSPNVSNSSLVSANKSRPAGPQNRKKPTVNPVKNLSTKSSSTTSNVKSNKSGVGNVSGFGLLASVVNNNNNNGIIESNQDGTFEWKNKKLQRTDSMDASEHYRLIRFTGKKSIVGRMVERAPKSIRSSCCYVLDAGDRIYEFRGANSNKIQQSVAMDLANRIKNKERGGRPTTFVIDDKSTTKNQEVETTFWKLLGGVRPTPSIPDETDNEKSNAGKLKDLLYQITIEGTTAKYTLCNDNGSGNVTKLNKDMLSSDQCYVVDSATEMYVWIGKQSPDTIRKQAMDIGKLVQTNRKGRPAWVKLERVVEGAEIELFKDKFGWGGTLPIQMAPTPKGRIAVQKEQAPFNVDVMYKLHPLSQHISRVVDDASGQIRIWRVKDHTKEEIPTHSYGHFYTGESYVILYKYIQKNKDMYIIYFWQGKKSSINDKGSVALLTTELGDTIGGAPHIRVVQNKEPIHFLNLFGGIIIVHQGIFDQELNNYHDKNQAMYHIRFCNITDTKSYQIRVIELNENSKQYLNSNDLFIIQKDQTWGIWKGSNLTYSIGGILNDSRLQTLLFKLMDRNGGLDPQAETVFICNESDNNDLLSKLFNVDQQQSYSNYKLTRVPILFQLSLSSGQFTVDPIREWDQEDLDIDDVMLLDIGEKIYLWTGKTSTQDERLVSMNTALEYAKKRTQEDIVYIVHSQLEPFEFTSLFQNWDHSKSRVPLDQRGNIPNQPLTKVSEYLRDLNRTYTLQELIHNPPAALDSTKLESYLSDSDFEIHFKVNREEFYNQKLWKQEAVKRSLGLY